MKTDQIDQIIHALVRAKDAHLEHANRLMVEHDYNAEFPAADAERFEEAITVLEALKRCTHMAGPDLMNAWAFRLVSLERDQLRARVKELEAHTCPRDPDAARYRKLQGWMSSNVPEGWREVENMAALCAWQDWAAMDAYLDTLGECNVGLMFRADRPVDDGLPF